MVLALCAILLGKALLNGQIHILAAFPEKTIFNTLDKINKIDVNKMDVRLFFNPTSLYLVLTANQSAT